MSQPLPIASNEDYEEYTKKKKIRQTLDEDCQGLDEIEQQEHDQFLKDMDDHFSRPLDQGEL